MAELITTELQASGRTCQNLHREHKLCDYFTGFCDLLPSSCDLGQVTNLLPPLWMTKSEEAASTSQGYYEDAVEGQSPALRSSLVT